MQIKKEYGAPLPPPLPALDRLLVTIAVDEARAVQLDLVHLVGIGKASKASAELRALLERALSQ